MAQVHPVRLPADEIIAQARTTFGDEFDLDLVEEQPYLLHFKGDSGFVKLDIRRDGNNQSRLRIEHHNYVDEIKAFRHILARRAASETSTS
jgi:hypothetical protein